MATVPQTAASSLARVEVLDLRHFSAYDLRPLLQQEATVWQRRLRWDYRDSIELLLQYLDSRMLPGFVATLRGQVIGYIFCVYEGYKAVIGDIYVSHSIDPEWRLPELLLKHLLEVASASPDLDRVESQLLLYNEFELAEPFHEAGFVRFPRLYQECDLTLRKRSWSPAISLPPDLELCPWTPAAYQPVAELIHAAYAGHLDAEINDQYRTLHGSLRFLHNIVRFPGCGQFDTEASWLLRDRRTQVLAGVVLGSRIAENVAHITQLCMAPEYRGRGLGRLLLEHSMERLAALRYDAITLTVSEQNSAAVQLYLASGFRTRHRFDAMVLNKPHNPFDLSGSA